jgi:hypothetical protein
MIRSLISCCLVLLCGTAAPAQAPKSIKLLLTPAKPPTPALRYQLLPDARLTISGDAAVVYKQIIDLLAKKPLGASSLVLSDLSQLPLNRLPKVELRKELAEHDEVFVLLDKAARCDRCDWGLLERLRQKGIGTLLPEIERMRYCAMLLEVKARLEMADGRLDQALIALRSGLALARNTGDAETLINFLVGVAITAIMERELDQFIALPDAPNLYYALTDLPSPLFSMRKGLQGERVSIYGTFPGLRDVATNLDAGPLTGKELALWVKVVDGLSKGNELLPPPLGRLWMGWNIEQKHEIAKKALIAAGRPREKVEAMPHVQVALLHALLDYDAALDNLIVLEKRPYWEWSDPDTDVNRRYLQDRWKDYNTSAIPLTMLLLPAVQRVTLARARMERKTALLRIIEAIRFYAADHDGRLPPSLAAIREVPIPCDPVTGKDFEYQVVGEIAKLSGPPPAMQTPNVGNTVVYELAIRK